MIANSTYREAKLRSNGLKQVKMENGKSSLMITFISVFWQGLWVPVGKGGGRKQFDFKGFGGQRARCKKASFWQTGL
jgi:hypothetical protein